MVQTEAGGVFPESVDVAIIGAGIAGLMAGTLLSRSGVSVAVVDKGRGIGGRMSTRRTEKGIFDHGAQYFTVRTEKFQRFVNEWLDAGVIREWFRHLESESGSTGHPRYIGVKGMSSIPRHLGETLPIRTKARVSAMDWDGRAWTLMDSSGASIVRGSFVLMTAPLPQTFALVEDALGGTIDFPDASRFRNFGYRRSLTALVQYAGPSQMGGFGGRKHDHPDVLWVADNHLKGISPAPGAVTIHSSYEFGEHYWDRSPEDWGRLLVRAVRDCCDGPIETIQTHRWRFNLPENPIEAEVFLKRREHLVLAGDAFGGPRVEGSALSGMAAAEKLVEIL